MGRERAVAARVAHLHRDEDAVGLSALAEPGGQCHGDAERIRSFSTGGGGAKGWPKGIRPSKTCPGHRTGLACLARWSGWLMLQGGTAVSVHARLTAPERRPFDAREPGPL